MSTHLAQRPRPVVPPILILLPVVVVLAATADPARPAEPSLIPWPRSRVEAPGLLPLGEASRIVAADPSLVPLAEVLAGEIEQVFRRRPGVAGGGARAGDIVLEIDPSLSGEAYRLDVGDRAVVRGGGYRAIALGTTTVLQSLVEAPGGLALPKGAIQDAPRYRMRAVQMCIKHQVHDIAMLRQGVDLCRMYKLDVLALHLSNYQVLWLLSPAFRVDPLPKGNFDGGATYEPAEIAELVEYARRRGVEILPEWGPTDFLFPGLMMEWLFKAEGSRLGAYGEFDAAKRTLVDDPRYWEAIDDLTRRLAAAFPHSEYIHVGAVDGETAQFEGAPDRAFMKAHGLRGSADVWGWLLARLGYRTSPPEAAPPTPDIEYSGPIAIDDTTTFWVGLGKEGYCLTTTIRSDGFQEGLLTSGRAKASATGARQIGDPTLVVDGFAANPDAHWNGIGEASLTIELVEPSRMNELQVFCWWGDGRAYRYTVEVLPDGEGWRPLVDMSENTMPSGPEGYSHRFETMAVKALRFHVLGNTVNDHGHLCEVRAREARAPEVPASR